MRRVTISDDLETARVPPESAGQRFDAVAATLFPDYSRAVLTGWIRAGLLLLDGVQAPPKTRLVGGEELTCLRRETATAVAQEPKAVPVVAVVYEDSDLVVLNKPAGLVVHPGAGNPDGTLADGVRARWPAVQDLPRSGIVHRLDKDTSGLMVVALSHRGHKGLTEQLRSHEVARRYLAVAEGCLVSGRTIDAPIGRHPMHRTRQALRDDGRDAITHLRIYRRYRAHTALDVQLETGRTHQIRVHLSALGYPLVGDRRYGARGRLPVAPTPELIALIQGFPRQALHALELTFTHPGSGELLAFEAPLPDDLRELLAVLDADREQNEGASR